MGTWGARARSLWTARRSERPCSATAHGRLYMEFDIRQTKYFLARGCIQRKQRRLSLCFFFFFFLAQPIQRHLDLRCARRAATCQEDPPTRAPRTTGSMRQESIRNVKIIGLYKGSHVL